MMGRYGKSVDKSFLTHGVLKKTYQEVVYCLNRGGLILDLFIIFGGKYDSVNADDSNLYWNLEVKDNVFAFKKY